MHFGSAVVHLALKNVKQQLRTVVSMIMIETSKVDCQSEKGKCTKYCCRDNFKYAYSLSFTSPQLTWKKKKKKRFLKIKS